MSLNIENIRKVRDVIAGLPAERFGMDEFMAVRTQRGVEFLGDMVDANRQVGSAMKGCGTVACIAGWTVAVLKPRAKVGAASSTVATELLGLSGWEGKALFMPAGWVRRGAYTQAQAVAVLDHLMATGEVDWSVAAEPKSSEAPQVVR